MSVTGHLELDVVKPDGPVLTATIDECVIPGLQGYFGVNPGHTPFLTVVGTGELMYRSGPERRYLAISGGFCEVQPDRVTVLAEVAETAEDIDVGRAERARDRAEQRVKELFQGVHDERIVEARKALERARLRLRVAARRAG